MNTQQRDFGKTMNHNSETEAPMNQRTKHTQSGKFYSVPLMILTTLVIFIMLSAVVARVSYADVTTIRPDGVTVSGAWTGVSAGNLNDQADGTFADITGAASTFTVSLANDAAYSGATINSVTLWVRAQSLGGGGQGERIDVGPTGALSGTPVAVSRGSFGDQSFVPAGPFSDVDVNNLEMDVATSNLGGGETMQVAEVWAVVDYTPAASPNEVTTCDACHTQPPVEEASRNGLTGAVVGSHASHNTYACTVCHPNNVVLNHRGAGSGDTGGQIEMLANIQSGTYDKGVAFAQANDLTGAGLGTCSDVSCHGGAASTSPQWGNNGTLACDSCHALPPATNAHTTHYTSKGWATGVETNCTACHPDNTGGHSDVTDGTVIVNAGLAPSGASPAISCGNAPALGCHNGKATPNWNTSGIGCADCHTAGGTDPADPTSGLHDETPTVSGVIHNPSNANFSGCEDCHTASPSDNHWDGTAQNSAPIINFDAGATGFTDGAPPTCASSCHSESAASEAWDRKWHENSDQANGTECAGCHGDWTTGWNGSVLHRTDADPQSTHGTGTNYECKDCHGLEAGSGYTWAGNHMNDLITINQNGHTFGRSGGLSGCAPCHAQYDGTDGAANQHSFTTTGWNLDLINGDTINAGCDSCHGGAGQYWPNGAAYPDRPGRHDEHMTQLATNLGITLPGTDTEQKRMCEYCHNDAGGVGGSGHSSDGGTDSTADVGAFNPFWDTGNPPSVNDAGSAYVADGCNSIACHNNKNTGNTNFGWYDATVSTCTMCHTEGGNGGAEIADPTSGLHDVTPTISGQRHGDAMGCVTCHTATPSADHIGGTSSTPNFSGSVGYSAGAPATCANACHAEDAMGTNWAHKWHENTGNATASCQGCHGDWTNGWNSGVRHRTTAGTESTHGSGGTYGCLDCHVLEASTSNYTFTFGGNDWGGASNHGNGQITMNDDGGGTITDWQRGTGGNSAKSLCVKCHTDWNDAAKFFVNTNWPPEELTGDGINASCTGCHNGSGGTATQVTDTSPHALSATGFACEECHTGHGAGTIEIPNNTAVGINYTGNGEGGIALGGSATSGSTQAEICWNCHGAAHSEWGTNTGSSYDYGSVSTPNWTTATWSSANFSYKNGTLDTPPGGQGRASFHDTGRSWPGGSTEAVADVNCSYCHDVHDTMGPNGKPYLRGAWRGNPYPEDGAPRAGDTYNGGGTPYGDVPRGNTNTTGPGGFHIDQNNGSPNSGVGTNLAAYTSTDGLCELCHDAATLVSQAPLHKNPVKYFSASYNDNSTARNIFDNSDRSASLARTNPGMAYQGVTDYIDAKGWMGGLRAKDVNSGAAVPPTIGGRYGYQAGNFEWNVTVNNSTVDVDYHQFTCSKCHTPHASRLPRLMITNCLDTNQNTWDDQFQGNGNWSNWNNMTPGNNNQLSQTKSAQNCHRYTGEATGPGWNSVTP